MLLMFVATSSLRAFDSGDYKLDHKDFVYWTHGSQKFGSGFLIPTFVSCTNLESIIGVVTFISWKHGVGLPIAHGICNRNQLERPFSEATAHPP